jgi:uncharacterized protein YjiS (DUF1127 family)
MKQRKQSLEMSMNATETARHNHAGTILARAASALKRLCVAYLTWRTEHAVIAFLQSMSDRELTDIGLSRSDIPGAVQRIWVREGTIPHEMDSDVRVGAAFSPTGYAQSC